MEQKTGRLASLDALRGFDMFWIMGGDALLVAVLGLFGIANGWDLIGHVEWHGLHFEDFIFPTFLFMAGASFPFSAAKSRERGMSPALIYVWVRPVGARIVSAATYIALCWLFLLWLYRRKVFLKI